MLERLLLGEQHEEYCRNEWVIMFGRIFYYRDELLRINSGSTCVVKVDGLEGNDFSEFLYMF